MFSGIITDVGTLLASATVAESTRLRVESDLYAVTSEPLTIGESIAHNGVCLTVVAVDPSQRIAEFDVGSETLRCTTIGCWKVGEVINLERSLRLNDRIDGHLVQGHVDCVARIEEIELQTSTYRVRIELPEQLAKFVAQKGSICVDGVSLTVGALGASERGPGWFEVFIIPHTWRVTRFHTYQVGTVVNLEVDCVSRYVVRAIEASRVSLTGSGN